MWTESDEMKQGHRKATGAGDKHAKRQQHGERNGPLGVFVCSSCRGCSNMVIDRETLRQGPWSLGPPCAFSLRERRQPSQPLTPPQEVGGDND